MMNTISFDQSHFCQSHFFFPSSDLTSIHRDTNFLGERNRITIQLRSITTIEVNFTLIALISIRSDAGMHSCFSEHGGTPSNSSRNDPKRTRGHDLRFGASNHAFCSQYFFPARFLRFHSREKVLPFDSNRKDFERFSSF